MQKNNDRSRKVLRNHHVDIFMTSQNFRGPRTVRGSLRLSKAFDPIDDDRLNVTVIIRFDASSIVERKLNTLRENSFRSALDNFCRNTQTSVFFVFLSPSLFSLISSLSQYLNFHGSTISRKRRTFRGNQNFTHGEFSH